MEIRAVGLVGGGKMSCEIFKLACEQDLRIVLWVRRADAIPALEDELLRKLRRRAKKAGEEGAKAQQRLAQLSITTDMRALADVDLVIESVAEVLSAKREVFSALDQIVRPDCIVTTNTSSLSPSNLATLMSRPERFAGLHFFYPASLVSFVEVISASKTPPELTETLVDFVRTLGKRPIRVLKEVSAYLVNRLITAYYNEGNGAVGEGTWYPDEIDKAGKRFAMMGPCESMDHVGIDVMFHGHKDSDESWGEPDHLLKQTRGLQPWPAIYAQLVKDGRLGIKSGVGFYKYENRQQLVDRAYFESIWPSMPLFQKYPKGDEQLLLDRLWYSIVLEAIVTDERGIGSRQDIDLTLKELLGLETAPFAWLEKTDLEKARARCRELEALFGARFAPLGVLKG